MDTAVRHALSCCCFVGDDDAHQITYPGDPKIEEGLREGPFGLPPSGNGQLQFRRPSPGPPASSRSPGSAPSTARSSLSPEERQKEKERLQDMVKEFAKAVVQGQQCQWLPSTVGAPLPATYSFDKALRNFSICPEDAPPMRFEMMKIHEVLKDVRDTPFSGLRHLPPPHALAGDELERRFVCVQHEDGSNGPDQYLGLLMPNPYERERFYTCMKILRWAMDSRREKS